MEGLGAPQSPPPAAAAISAVLDDDDLLCEILLRVAFPTSLVRAALVCKHWLHLVSAPAFLRRFRGLHRPHFLGFYVTTERADTPRFVPLPQPPELAAVVRRASFDLDSWGCWNIEADCTCTNGLLLLCYRCRHVNQTVRILHCPLYPARNMAVLPPVPDASIHDGATITYDLVDSEILYDGVGHDLTYFYFGIASNEQQTVVDVYVLQEDTWTIYSSTVSDIPEIDMQGSTFIGGDNKIYSVACVSQETTKLFLLDLMSSSLSLVNLPEEVNTSSVDVSLAEDSVVHLTHVKDFRIRIWLHRMDKTGVADWFLVNTICLRKICANNMIPSHVFEVEEEFIFLCAVGENFEFVLLEKNGVIYMFDLKRKSAKKVYEAPEDELVYSVSTFMMVWPPKFPAIMEGCDPKE